MSKQWILFLSGPEVAELGVLVQKRIEELKQVEDVLWTFEDAHTIIRLTDVHEKLPDPEHLFD